MANKLYGTYDWVNIPDKLISASLGSITPARVLAITTSTSGNLNVPTMPLGSEINVIVRNSSRTANLIIVIPPSNVLYYIDGSTSPSGSITVSPSSYVKIRMLRLQNGSNNIIIYRIYK